MPTSSPRAGHTAAQQGFTLVEIALALLVIAIGIVTVVGLFPAGLETNKASIDETRMAMFAEEVLNGVKAFAAEENWGQLTDSGFELPASAPDLWDPSVVDDLDIVAGEIRTHKYVYSANLQAGLDGVEAYALRYRLMFVPPIDEVGEVGQSNRKGVRLEVWNGEYGPLEDGRVFYTELYYNGR